MCVTERGLPWERPATQADFPFLSRYFPDMDFDSAWDAMRVHGFQPLPTDLVLLAGVLASVPDAFGVRSVPFSGFHTKKQTIVKFSFMDGIVPWMENTALGTAMWRSVSDWTKATRGTVIEFTMKCSCIEVPAEDLENGRYGEWLERFHASRNGARGIFGKQGLPVKDSILGTDITLDQLCVWKKIGQALWSLPPQRALRPRVA